MSVNGGDAYEGDGDDDEESQLTEGETRGVHTEMKSMYQKLLDGKRNDPNELNDMLMEANKLIVRLKSTHGQGVTQDMKDTQGQALTEDSKIFRLLCDIVKKMSKDLNTKEQKFHMEEYAIKLTRKFNFSTDNSGNIIVTKLQVISLGKEISKYFSRAPTLKFVLGALDTVEGDLSTTINDLPHELLKYIFLKLPLEDRKIAVLVSRWWRQVGEDKVLWECCVITIRNAEDISKLSLPRIKHVQQICVYRNLNWNVEAQQLEDFLKATLELPKLKEIDELQWIDLRSVNSQLLAKALVRLETLVLQLDTKTTNDQRVEIFNHMAETSSTKNLNVSVIDLSTLDLDAGIIAKALSGVECLGLQSVSLNNDQAHELLESMSENNQLNTAWFEGINLSSVSAELFGAALAQVETLSLDYMEVSPEQVRSLLAEMDGRSRMESIILKGIDMSTADPKLLARVMSMLEQVILIDNNLKNQQVHQLFTEMKQNSSKISFLGLSYNDLSPVDPDDLANVVNNIEEVDLEATELSTQQITAILTRVQANTKLQELDIRGNDISQVDLAIVTKAKEIIGGLDIDSEDEDDSSDEEDSLDGFIVSESDSDLEGEDESHGDN